MVVFVHGSVEFGGAVVLCRVGGAVVLCIVYEVVISSTVWVNAAHTAIQKMLVSFQVSREILFITNEA